MILVTAVLGFFAQVNAQSVDPVVEAGVQILLEKHEIMHLKENGQITPEKAQERLQANKQRWDKYSLTIAQWPKEKQLALAEQIKKRSAVALATREQTRDSEALRLQKKGSAQAGQESVNADKTALTATGGAPPSGEGGIVPDVIGIRLGMTADEVMAALQTFNPVFNITVLRYNEGKDTNGPPYSIQASYTDPVSQVGEEIKITLSVPPSRPVVLAIVRTHTNIGQVVVKQYRDALYAKYGKEQRVEGAGGQWYFNEKHNPAPPPKIADPRNMDCSFRISPDIMSMIINQGKPFSGPQSRLAQHLEYLRIKPACGTVLEVTEIIHPYGGQELLNGFTMSLIDYPAYAQAFVAGSSHEIELQNARMQQELEKAKQSSSAPRL